jgi:hypothetical protein
MSPGGANQVVPAFLVEIGAVEPALSKPARLATGAQRFDREKMHRRGEGLG